MHIFSIVILAFFVINIFRKAKFKNKLIWQTAFTVFIYLFVNRGYFIESKILNVDNWQGVLILHFLFLVAYKKIRRINNSALLYCTYLVFSVALLVVFPANGVRLVGGDGRIDRFLSGAKEYLTTAPFTKLTIFFCGLAILQIIVMSSTFRLMDKDDIRELIRVMAIFVKIVVGIVIIEFLLKNVLQTGNLYNEILIRIFGYGTASYNDLALRGNTYMLTGLNREGSHIVYSLAIGVGILFADMKIRKQKREGIWIFVAMLMMIVSKAFTFVLAFIFIALLYIIYYTYSMNKTMLKRELQAVVLLCVLTVGLPIAWYLANLLFGPDGYIMTRLSDAIATVSQIFQQGEAYFSSLSRLESTTVRFYSVVHTLGNWLQRPLLGVGIATTYCHGPAVLTLCEIGVLGVVFFYRAYFRPVILASKNKKAVMLTVIVWFALSTLSGVAVRLYVGIDGFILAYCMQALLESEDKGQKIIGVKLR